MAGRPITAVAKAPEAFAEVVAAAEAEGVVLETGVLQ